MKSSITAMLAGTVMLALGFSAADAQAQPERVAEARAFAEFIVNTHPDGAEAQESEEWPAAMSSLEAVAQSGSQEEYVVALLRLLAVMDDGHTTIPLGTNIGNGFFLQRLPVRFGAFDDGFYVIGAKDEALPLLGGRVTSIGGMPIEDVLNRFLEYWPADNEANAYSESLFLGLPIFLAGMGLSEGETAPVSVAVEFESGETTEATLQPQLDANVDRQSVEANRFERDVWAEEAGAENFVRALPDRRAIFVRVSAVRSTDGVTFGDLTNQLAAAMETPGYDRLIIDLRGNGGGDNMLIGLLRRHIASSEFNAPGRLFVLTSPETYSAAVNFAGRLERETFAVFVGEPTGAGPNHSGDAERLVGANTGLTISVSELHWQDSTPFDQRRWIMPDVYTPLTYADWLAGHDAALAAALQFEETRAVNAPTWYAPWARSSQAETWTPFWRR